MERHQIPAGTKEHPRWELCTSACTIINLHMDSIYLRIGLNGTLRPVKIVGTTTKTNSAKTLNMKLIIAIAGVNEKKNNETHFRTLAAAIISKGKNCDWILFFQVNKDLISLNAINHKCINISNFVFITSLRQINVRLFIQIPFE